MIVEDVISTFLLPEPRLKRSKTKYSADVNPLSGVGFVMMTVLGTSGGGGATAIGALGLGMTVLPFYWK